MKSKEKIEFLRRTIVSALTPLIQEDYILLDIPYYDNIGDVLIWEGTKAFLTNIPHRCILSASKESFLFPILSRNVTILLSGGGNFGDLWHEHQDFRIKVIESYPENRIIVLPQTVFYRSLTQCYKDAQTMRKHSNLIICARDKKSYKTLTKYSFSNKLVLLPDMAFCISNLPPVLCEECNQILFLRRKDIEYSDYNVERFIPDSERVETHDWPSMELASEKWQTLLKFIEEKDPSLDMYADSIFRPYMVQQGVEFLGKYQSVYTTRLHVFILSILLGKSVVLFDNSYGKNSDFFYAWMTDCEGATLIPNPRKNINRIMLRLKCFIKKIIRKIH